MIMRRVFFPFVAIAAAAWIAWSPVGIATVLAQQEPLGDTIPHDPQTTVGTLPNGLRYYIRRNTQPRNRAELRLAAEVV